MAYFSRGLGPSSARAALSILVSLAIITTHRTRAQDDEPVAQANTMTLSRLKTFKYLDQTSDAASNSRDHKLVRKSSKLIQNLIPLEYDLQLDFSETGKFRNNINGLVEIYFQHVNGKKAVKKACTLMRTIKGMTNSMSCMSILPDPKDSNRLIKLHVGEGVTVRVPRMEFGASLEELRQNRGEEVPIESQQLNEHSRVLSISLAKPFEFGTFGRLSLRFESYQPYDYVRYTHKRTAPDEPPTPPLEAYVNFRFTRASIEHTFPCLNSAKFKSKVSLTIVADRKLRAFSNMPPIDIRDDPEGRRNLRGELLRRTVFAPTPPIPIHKLLYSLGPFEAEPTELMAGGQPRVGLVAPANLASPTRSRFALELAQEALDWMRRKVGQELPIRQLTLVATHARDFNSTSSLGIALIDAGQLLYDPAESSPVTKLLVAWNVAHVIAQQWFGGLVTERRSRDHWILDGLAGQLALEMLQELRPEMGATNYIRSHLLMRAMYIRAVRFSADMAEFGDEQKQALINELIQLSYIKSTAIIGMLQTLVGREKFQSIVGALPRGDAAGQAPSNRGLVDQEGLVALLAGPERSAEEWNEFIDAWRNHPSFPAISVQPDQSNPNRAIQLYQIPIHKLSRLEIGLWPNRNGVQVPLQIMFSNRQGTERETVRMPDAFREVQPGEVPMWNGQLVETPGESFKLRDHESGHWLKVLDEPSTLRFFVVLYTSAGNILNRLKPAIETFAMGADDRLSLLQDATTLAQVKPHLSQTLPCEELISWFRKEPIIQVIDAVLSLSKACQHDKRAWKPPTNAIKLFERHGFLVARPGEKDFEQFVRSTALTDLVRGGHKPATEAALKIFEQDRQRASSTLLRPAIYAALARAGSPEQIETLFKQLDRSKWPEEIDRVRAALDEVGDADVRSRLRDWCNAHNCQV